MSLFSIISSIISGVAFITGIVSWMINLKLKHDVAVANDVLEKDIMTLRTEFVRELGILKQTQTERLDSVEKEIATLSSGLDERMLSKYVRSDLYLQALAGIQERFLSLKDLVEISLSKIEQNLNQQISSLKERLSK